MTDEGSDAAETTATVADAVADVEVKTDIVVDDAEVVVDDIDSPAEVVVAEAPRRGYLFPALIGALLALLLGAGFLGWKVWQQHQLNQASEEAQRTAVAYAQVLTSVDSNNVDENFKEVLDGATGEFKDMYSKSSVELRQLLIENKATAHGVVVESAVQSATKDKAVVLLFVDQSVSNTKLPDPRIDRSRMKMTLEKVDGRWRASKIELP